MTADGTDAGELDVAAAATTIGAEEEEGAADEAAATTTGALDEAAAAGAELAEELFPLIAVRSLPSPQGIFSPLG